MPEPTSAGGPATGAYLTTILSYADSFGGLGNISSNITYRKPKPLPFANSHSVLNLSETAAVDPARIEAAATGVAERWRFWAGRAKFDSELNRWTVRVPTGPLPPRSDYPLIRFLATSSPDPYPITLPPTCSATTAALPNLPADSLIVSNTPYTMKALEATSSPLVAVRVATFANYQSVSFTISHAIADAKALGLYMRAFNAELNCVEWEVPELETDNRLDAAIAAQLEENAGREDTAARPELSILEGGWGHGTGPLDPAVKSTLSGADAEGALDADEEDGGVFVGSEVADRLVGRVKAEVTAQTGGKEYVSTHEVLVAWLLKAAYAEEPNHGQVKKTHSVDLRRLMDVSSSLNNILCYLTPHYPSPHHSSLADMALFSRRALTAVYSATKFAAYQAWLRSFPPEEFPPWICLGEDSWNTSNQSQAGIADAVDWGSGQGKKQVYWCKQLPRIQEGTIMLNKLEHGWTFTGVMRASRWASLRNEVARLGQEFEMDQVR